jgi:hypothetical protein
MPPALARSHPANRQQLKEIYLSLAFIFTKLSNYPSIDTMKMQPPHDAQFCPDFGNQDGPARVFPQRHSTCNGIAEPHIQR